MKNIISYVVQPVQRVIKRERELVDLLNRTDKILARNEGMPSVQEYKRKLETERITRLYQSLSDFGIQNGFNPETRTFRTWWGAEIGVEFTERGWTSKYDPRTRKVKIKVGCNIGDKELAHSFLHERGHSETMPVPGFLGDLAVLSWLIAIPIHEAIAEGYACSKLGWKQYKECWKEM